MTLKNLYLLSLLALAWGCSGPSPYTVTITNNHRGTYFEVLSPADANDPTLVKIWNKDKTTFRQAIIKAGETATIDRGWEGSGGNDVIVKVYRLSDKRYLGHTTLAQDVSGVDYLSAPNPYYWSHVYAPGYCSNGYHWNVRGWFPAQPEPKLEQVTERSPSTETSGLRRDVRPTWRPPTPPVEKSERITYPGVQAWGAPLQPGQLPLSEMPFMPLP
jgi:hypothetical protein